MLGYLVVDVNQLIIRTITIQIMLPTLKKMKIMIQIEKKDSNDKIKQQQQYVTKTDKNVSKIKYVQVSQRLSIVALLKNNLTNGGFADLAQAFLCFSFFIIFKHIQIFQTSG